MGKFHRLHPRVVRPGENLLARGSCGILWPPLLPLMRQLACGKRVRSLGRPPRLSILERHARASSLGAPRRPARAAGLTRVRLARSGNYVMASRCLPQGVPKA